jgi:5-methylthioribose kinase
MIEHEKNIKSLQFDYPKGLKHFEFFTDKFIVDIFEDTIGFASCEMFRRTVGLAKVADIADIEDLDKRARKEAEILDCASVLVKSKSKLKSIDEVLEIVLQKSQS